MTISELPAGVSYVEGEGIVVEGVVARQIPEHPVGARPGRKQASVAFNRLAHNTALTMFLGEFEPGGTKCGHRHFDETLMLFVSGSGWSELRQDDSSPLARVEWTAGDLLVIPMNAWHEHFNADAHGTARVLSFKSSTIFGGLIGPEAKEQLAAVRLRDRYDDEPGFFTRRGQGADGVVQAAFAPQIADDPLPEPDRALGEGVALARYVLAGQRGLVVTLTGIGPGGRVRPHRPLAEEAFYVLRGSGRTDLWTESDNVQSVAWRAGDLVSPPLGVWRQHANTGAEAVRLLGVRTTAIQRALGIGDLPLVDASPPDRYPRAADPGGQ